MADDTGTATTSAATPDPAAAAGAGDPAGASTDTGEGDLGDPGKKALNAERLARRNAEKAHQEAMARLKEFEDRDKSELQKAIERAEAAEKLASTTSLDLARVRVATAAGLSPEMASRLQGKDEAELTADAASLKQQLGLSTAATSFDGGTRTTSGKPADMNDLIRGARSR